MPRKPRSHVRTELTWFLYPRYLPLDISFPYQILLPARIQSHLVADLDYYVEPKRTTSDDDGAFFLMQMPDGEYHLTVEYTGFQIYSSQFQLRSDKLFTIALKESPIEVKGITTTAMRATRENSPVTFSEISSEAIIEVYNVQDVPMLLQYTPGAFSYSETGTGIGYTHFNIRGFNQQRMNVMINGIPQNDPESHGVYWVDLPDILNNTDDVQIQRGVGFSTDGSAAFGGSINLQTKAYGKCLER